MERFGTLIRRHRFSRGWTLEDVARRLRTHRGYVSGWENGGVNPPSAKLVIRLAKLYGLDQEDLLLRAWSEKAPKEIRAALKYRLFGAPRLVRKSDSNAAQRKRRVAEERLEQAFELLSGIVDLAWPERLAISRDRSRMR